ncbi:hypothetical protein FXF51_21280 [Nonomuraea sp. PA05]|uniref:hypothetical protein n=1 Tax=Nonomuraea sp. PA05 TaxID=2604466 RepID=UPI0011D5D931|nr:hypothetical protein [Nonomuraea sp. PA05]TYB64270.1 hypothetical protein FXF51_21280 [Nonomuraea sp. PA05]
MDYPLALALVDFLPVLAMAAGIALLVPYIARTAGPLAGRAALAGGVLVVLGGLLKAVWKLLVAAGGPDVAWLAGVQFYLFGPGFALLAWAVLSGRRPGLPGLAGPVGSAGPPSRPGPPFWALAGFALAGVAGALATGATWPLLIVTTVCATILGVRLLLLSRHPAGRALFGFNLLGTYVMGLLASRPEQTIALQWVEETLNTLIWTAFAVAVQRLTREDVPAGGRSELTGETPSPLQ